MLRQLDEQLGRPAQVASSYKINSVAIQPDGKSAIVDYSSSLDVADDIFNARSRSTATLIRRNGKTLMQRSEARSSVRSSL